MKLMSLKRKWSLALVTAFAVLLPLSTFAEDIDIFVGGGGGGGAANVLIVLDNTSNWSRNDQRWPGGVKQGQSELQAIKAAVAYLNDTVHVGLMMFTDNASGREGGYVRYAMRPMNTTNRENLRLLLQQIHDNFGTPAEKSASSANYSGVLFDAFKYFGGYTSPANARTNVAGTPLGPTAFGTQVYATQTNIPAANVAPYGTLAYADPAFISYQPPAVAGDECGGKNYIIFIGNGFPNTDTLPGSNLKDFLAGVGGNTAQIRLNEFTTTKPTTDKGLSAACYKNNPGGLGSCSSANASTCGPAYETCVCATPTSAAGCTGSEVHYTVLGSGDTTIVTPTSTTYDPTGRPTERYPDEWTRFLYQTDVNAAPGQQNVTTYSIDVFNAKQDADQTALLYSMANSAGGKYFPAKSQAAIETALNEIFIEIQATNSVFASATLPVSATNRSESEPKVFLSLFRPDPDARPRWFGNLKQYKIADDAAGVPKLTDQEGRNAINPLSGFITECASSFWTSDSGKYWAGIATDPSPASKCISSGRDPFSDAPDGPTAEKGGIAEILRQGNNPAAAPTWALSRNIFTKGFVSFDTTNVSATELAANDVNFIRGENIGAGPDPTPLAYSFLDPAGISRTTTIRPAIHGDVVHSRPLAVNYGGSTGTIVYYGSNDGTFRAVKAGVTGSPGTGEELWAYVAPEFYSRLPRLRQNSPIIKYSFLATGIVTPEPTPKDYFFDGSSGILQNRDRSLVHIFPTMRRGGRMVYAFDVSTPATPSLLWNKGCPNLNDDTACSTGMGDIGQTWSTPSLARLKVDGLVKPVVIVGGGYDNCEDGAASAACSAGKGAMIYVLDAATGAIIRSFATTGRVPSDVALIDVDYDGLPDLAYVGDTRGNVYRVSFGLSKTAPLASSDWVATRVAYTNGANRKFLYRPSLLPVFDKTTGKYYVYLALGSGDREQPLITQYPYTTPVLNRFYVYMDDISSTTAVNLDDAAAMSDFTSASACGVSRVVPGSGKSGWFMDLNQYGRGEQTVSGAVIISGLIAFSTNRPVDRLENACTPRGEARGYWVNLFNASGAIGSPDTMCGGDRSGIFEGGGLPPSPTLADVGDKTLCIGCASLTPPGGGGGPDDRSSSLAPERTPALPPQKRSRVYYKLELGN